MTTREQLVEAVVCELRLRGTLAASHPVQTADAIADRLGLVAPAIATADTLAPPPPEGEGRLGVGVFVRRISDWPIELLARFDWAVVAVLSSGRGAMNRDASWWRDAGAAGVVLMAMDWLPSPERWRSGLADGIAWSSAHGSTCWINDAEREWVRQALEAARYVEYARAQCDASGCGLGLTSYATLPRHWPSDVLVSGCGDITIPQPYDRWGAYEPGYATRVLERYRELGATRLAVGRGAFVDPDAQGPKKSRWRRPLEIARHRETTPPLKGDLVGECWWPPRGKPPAGRVEAIVGDR